MSDLDVVENMRRRRPIEERRQIIAESETASVSAVARRHGVAASQVFRWRRQAGLPGKRTGAKKASATSVPVTQTALAAHEALLGTPIAWAPDGGLIEIELRGGRRVRLTGAVDVQNLKRLIAVLEGP